jgi:hypothetical protein
MIIFSFSVVSEGYPVKYRVIIKDFKIYLQINHSSHAGGKIKI